MKAGVGGAAFGPGGAKSSAPGRRPRALRAGDRPAAPPLRFPAKRSGHAGSGACKKSVGGYIRSRYAAPIIPASLPRAARRIGGVPMASEAITYPGVLRFSRSVR